MNKRTFPIDTVRHSLAHIMASAVQHLFGNAIKLGIGPTIENGFYYDFDFGKKEISESAFPQIENEMRRIIKEDHEFKRKELSIAAAKKIFSKDRYKLELLNDIERYGTTEYKTIAARRKAKKPKTVSIYETGNFVDLCRGPHANNTRELRDVAFKLEKIAGAYFRGDEKRPMMTRIYATAFYTKSELEAYIKRRQEAEARDHKKLGKELDLFVFSDLVGSGLPLWTPHGTIIRELLDQYVWSLRQKFGYQKVEIPHITKKELYQTSGHWEKFSNELFRITTREGHEFAIKPMNCPHHTQVYARKKWSYREMPQRYATSTMCYRDEQTGELSGLTRLRSFTQDDAHVFCREDQLKDEVLHIWDIVHAFYDTFGFDLKVRLSVHDPKKMGNYLGSLKQWEKTVSTFRAWLDERGAQYFIGVGEAAFYGPKIDFIAKDSLEREWQVATIQVDNNMPQRFNLGYINNAGENEPVVMIHAAIMGAIERFIAILLEHTAGSFPLWLAPVQIQIAPVSQSFTQHAKSLKTSIEEMTGRDNHAMRIYVDESDTTVSSKIRDAAKQKIPYTIVIGEKEAPISRNWSPNTSITVRRFGKKETFSTPIDAFCKRISEEITQKK